MRDSTINLVSDRSSVVSCVVVWLTNEKPKGSFSYMFRISSEENKKGHYSIPFILLT